MFLLILHLYIHPHFPFGQWQAIVNLPIFVLQFLGTALWFHVLWLLSAGWLVIMLVDFNEFIFKILSLLLRFYLVCFVSMQVDI